MIYLVTYNIESEELRQEVKSTLAICGEIVPFQPTACLLSSVKTARDVRDMVRGIMRPESTIFISEISRANWAGLNTRLQAWIASHSV